MATWLQINDKAEQSLLNRTIDYTETTRGSSRSLNALRLVSELWNECAQDSSRAAQEMGKIASASLSGMGIIGLPSAVRDAYKGMLNVEKSTSDTFWRNVGGAVQDGLEAIASWMYALDLFMPHPLLGKVARSAELTEDTLDLCCSWNDYVQADTLAQIASGDAQEALIHTRDYQYWRVAKTICAVAGGVFGMLALVVGVQVLPAIAAITLSLMSTALAIRLALWETEGRFKLVDFKQQIHLVG